MKIDDTLNQVEMELPRRIFDFILVAAEQPAGLSAANSAAALNKPPSEKCTESTYCRMKLLG